MSVELLPDAPGLYALAFVAVAILTFVVIPYCLRRADEQEAERQHRRDERRRAEHFTLTDRFHRQCEPVFEGLARMGNDLDRT